MPIYEYSCKDCGSVTEFLEGVGAGEKLPSCKDCGSTELVRLFPSAFVAQGVNSSSEDIPSCCGLTNPCDDPKRCCGR